MTDVNFKYTGTALPTGANDYVLLDTTLELPGYAAAMFGWQLCQVSIDCSQDGDLELYKSDDRGTTWYQVQDVQVAAPAAGTRSLTRLPIAGLKDFKVNWENGGVTQTQFTIDISVITEGAVIP